MFKILTSNFWNDSGTLDRLVEILFEDLFCKWLWFHALNLHHKIGDFVRSGNATFINLNDFTRHLVFLGRCYRTAAKTLTGRNEGSLQLFKHSRAKTPEIIISRKRHTGSFAVWSSSTEFRHLLFLQRQICSKSDLYIIIQMDSLHSVTDFNCASIRLALRLQQSFQDRTRRPDMS